MVVLKGIPSVLSPELLYALARMGHGDEIGVTIKILKLNIQDTNVRDCGGYPKRFEWLEKVLADANFPASSTSKAGPELIRADGLGIPTLLEAILQLFPLDTYVQSPAAVMDLVDSDKQRGLETPVWETYRTLLANVGCEASLHLVERFQFYDRAKKAFAVVATGETTLYGNLILKKGVIG